MDLGLGCGFAAGLLVDLTVGLRVVFAVGLTATCWVDFGLGCDFAAGLAEDLTVGLTVGLTVVCAVGLMATAVVDFGLVVVDGLPPRESLLPTNNLLGLLMPLILIRVATGI